MAGMRFAYLAAILVSVGMGWSSVRGAEFSDVLERDFALRTMGELHVVNLRGDVIVEGWTQDRIRLKAKRSVQATDEAEAKKLFSAMDFRFQPSPGRIELSAEYGRNLSIESRLQERKDPHTRMDMTVVAPAGMALKIWALNGKVVVRSWNSNVDVRTATGPVDIENSKGGNVSILCPECRMNVRSVKSSVRCMGGTGAIILEAVKGSPVYVESASGAVKASRVEGEQLYVTKSGPISGELLKGHVEFHSHHGAVEILNSAGFLSGRTQSGNITAEMKEWEFRDKALLESVTGNIALTLPSGFAGEVDLRSREGRVQSEFPISAGGSSAKVVMDPQKQVGTIGRGGDLLRIQSAQGEVRLLRGSGS